MQMTCVLVLINFVYAIVANKLTMCIGLSSVHVRVFWKHILLSGAPC